MDEFEKIMELTAMSESSCYAHDIKRGNTTAENIAALETWRGKEYKARDFRGARGDKLDKAVLYLYKSGGAK